jgi:hypothetical protein
MPEVVTEDLSEGGSGTNGIVFRRDRREDWKLVFRIALVSVIGVACLLYCLVPARFSEVPVSERGPAWAVLGAIVGNLLKGVMD